MIIESIKTSFKVLTTNKLRTILTMLGIVIGIFSVSIIFSISTGTRKSMKDSFSDFEQDTINVLVGKVSSIERELLEKDLNKYVNENDKVDTMGKTISVKFNEYEYALSVKNYDNPNYGHGYNYAIDENYTEVQYKTMEKIRIKKGRFLSKKDIVSKMPYIVLREDVAETLLGSSDVVGRKVNVNNYEFEIIGIMNWGSDEDVPNMFISYYFVNDEFIDVESPPVYIIKVKDVKDIKEVEGQLKNILGEYTSADHYDVYSMDLDEILKETESVVNLIELVFVGIASLSIVVGGIGIMNIMLVSVSERIKETGIRIALGARNIDIVFQFLIEGIMITIFSGIIGLSLAYGATIVANNILAGYEDITLKLILDFKSCIYIVLFCGILGIIFGIYPAIKASKLDPVEALKYE